MQNLRFCWKFTITIPIQKSIQTVSWRLIGNDSVAYFCTFSAFVGTDITEDVQMVTSNKGSTVMFYNGFKYLKSGESKTSFQYRCVRYMKKCRSRIIFNRENETTMKNEIFHNHDEDPTLYDSFMAAAVDTRCFVKNKNSDRKKVEKHQACDYETEK